METFGVIIGLLGLFFGILNVHMYFTKGDKGAFINVVGAIGGFVAFLIQYHNIVDFLF